MLRNWSSIVYRSLVVLILFQIALIALREAAEGYLADTLKSLQDALNAQKISPVSNESRLHKFSTENFNRSLDFRGKSTSVIECRHVGEHIFNSSGSEVWFFSLYDAHRNTPTHQILFTSTLVYSVIQAFFVHSSSKNVLVCSCIHILSNPICKCLSLDDVFTLIIMK